MPELNENGNDWVSDGAYSAHRPATDEEKPDPTSIITIEEPGARSTPAKIPPTALPATDAPAKDAAPKRG